MYESKYEATKKYVEWLVKMIGLDAVQTRKAEVELSG